MLKSSKILPSAGFSEQGSNVIYAQCKKTNKAVCKVNEKVRFNLVKKRLIDGIEKLG